MKRLHHPAVQCRPCSVTLGVHTLKRHASLMVTINMNSSCDSHHLLKAALTKAQGQRRHNKKDLIMERSSTELHASSSDFAKKGPLHMIYHCRKINIDSKNKTGRQCHVGVAPAGFVVVKSRQQGPVDDLTTVMKSRPETKLPLTAPPCSSHSHGS